MKKMLLTMLLGCALNAQAAVYKWVDEDGNVHFSDEPKHPNAEKIHVPPPSTYTPAPLPKLQPKPPETPVPNQGYNSFGIGSPANDAVLWDTGGEVMVSVNLDPALKTELGHRLEFSVDGRKIGNSDSSSYLITNIERGTHQITARVVNINGAALDSDSVTVHVRQRSLLDAPASSTPKVPTAPGAPRAPQAPRL